MLGRAAAYAIKPPCCWSSAACPCARFSLALRELQQGPICTHSKATKLQGSTFQVLFLLFEGCHLLHQVGWQKGCKQWKLSRKQQAETRRLSACPPAVPASLRTYEPSLHACQSGLETSPRPACRWSGSRTWPGSRQGHSPEQQSAAQVREARQGYGLGACLPHVRVHWNDIMLIQAEERDAVGHLRANTAQLQQLLHSNSNHCLPACLGAQPIPPALHWGLLTSALEDILLLQAPPTWRRIAQ